MSEGNIDTALAAVDQAIAIADETGERWAMAEVLRTKATSLLEAHKSTEAEACLIEGLRIAREQGARCWELRTAMDLARLWSQWRRDEAALEVLGSVYAQFTEGFDTPDLKDAKALLD